MGVPALVERQRPIASKFSSAKPIGSMRTWQDAHAGFRRCTSICSRIDSRRPSAEVACSSGTSGGGGGGGMPSRFSSTQTPRSTGVVRSGYDVTIRMPPWPSRPPRTPSANVTLRKRSPDTPGTP